DGGGSIRVPAHFCGICGLKPTPGRIPATGHFPPGAGALSWIGVVGPMARPDASDALSAPVPLRRIRAEELRSLRVGILESSALGTATPETQTAVHRAGQLLTEQGFDVEPMKLEGLGRALELWWFFFGAVIGDLIRHSTKGQVELLSPMLQEYLAATAAEPAVTLESFMAACTERDLVRADLLRQLRDVQILLS